MTTTQEQAPVEFRERHRDETAVTYEIRRYAETVRERNSSAAQILTAHAPYINEHLEHAALRQPQAARLTEEERGHLKMAKILINAHDTLGYECARTLVDVIDRLTAAPAPQVTKLGHPCGDMDCNKDREKKMVRVGTYNSKPVFCDPCIALIVQALNDGGIRTIASCCGHNRRPATIAIEGDMWLTLTDRKGMEKIAAIFPGDINGEERAAQQVTREEIESVRSAARASWFFSNNFDKESRDKFELDAIMSLLASRGLVKE